MQGLLDYFNIKKSCYGLLLLELDKVIYYSKFKKFYFYFFNYINLYLKNIFISQ